MFTLNTVYRVDNKGKYFPVSSTSYHHTLSFYHNLKRICYVSVTRKVHFWTFKISQNWKKFQFLKYLQIYLSLISIHFLILFICLSCVYQSCVYHVSILTVGSPWWLIRTSFTSPPGSKMISMRNISLLMMALFSVPVGGVNDRSTRRDVVSRRSNSVCWLTTKSTNHSTYGIGRTVLLATAIPN